MCARKREVENIKRQRDIQTHIIVNDKLIMQKMNKGTKDKHDCI